MLIPMNKLTNRFNVHPKGVLHIGANIGEEAEAYRRAGIIRQVWVEANLDLMDKLRSNIYPPHEKAYCFCVGDEHDKEVIFNITNNKGQSSSIMELGTHKQQHPDVYVIEKRTIITKRIDKYFENGELDGLDFLNIDLQGAELKALRGMGDLVRQFKWAYIEVNKNDVYVDCPHVNDIDLFLNGFGFKRVATEWCGFWGDALYIKR